MNFGIRQKFFSGFILIILLFTGSCMVGLSYLEIIVNSMTRTLEHPMVVNRASKEIEVLVLSIQRNMYGISLAHETGEIDRLSGEVKNADDQAQKLFSLVQRQILGNKGKILALNARIGFYDWRIIRNKTELLVRMGKYDQAQKINKTKGDANVRSLQAKLDEISDYAAKRAKEYTSTSVIMAVKARYVVAGIILVSILVSLFISFHLSSSFTLRLRSISIATTKMAKGDIKQSLEIKGHDELTQVAGNFNAMAGKLSETYENLEKKVQERTSELKDANEELQRVKSDLEGTVNERTKDLEEKISELNRSQLAMLYMIEDMNETSRQLKATQAELIRRERLAILGQFSGNISHELRNPLGVIDSSIYYLQMRLTDNDEKIRQHLDRISQSVKTATTIIENLLNLTRMNKPILVRYDLANLIDDCLKGCKVPDTVKVEEHFTEMELIVKAEKDQIRMAVDNLVTNAVASMNGEGILKVMIGKANENEAEVSFIDSGAGIDPEHLNQVFLPLFSTKAKGIGLGLSITKMIIENHKGIITAEAEPGKGAKFTLRFPLFVEGGVIPDIKTTEESNAKS